MATHPEFPSPLKNVYLDKEAILTAGTNKLSTHQYVPQQRQDREQLASAPSMPSTPASNDATERAVKELEHKFSELLKAFRMHAEQISAELKDVRSLAVETAKELRNRPAVAAAPVHVEQSHQHQDSHSITANAAPPKDASQPIDRNQVAPASVSIEKMFNFGNK
ncbi:hypothetical protein HZB02_05265 [Candidatus Woesearchaeota archaeon]|nr:hypothetical protein [Candidatus Woesearchaeota archaeon]